MECGYRGRMRFHVRDTRRRKIKLKGLCVLQKLMQMRDGVGK